MADYDEQFTPEEINEQIRHFSSASQHALQAGVDPNQRLMHDLRYVFSDDEVKEDAGSLQRSWERIALAQQHSGHASETTFNDREVLSMNTFTKEAEEASPRHTVGQRFGLLVAAIIALFLVGSMAFAFSMMRNYKTAQTQRPSTQTGAYGSSSHKQRVTTSKVKQGDTIAVFQQPGFTISGVNWSADGKRIVSTGQSVFSWDAMTGKNSVDYPTLPVPLPFAKSSSDSSVFATAIWSPDGKSFALPYYSDIQIWDGTTKELIKTLHYSLPISHTIDIRYVRWSANGRSISAIVPANNSVNGSTYTLVTFDLATGAKRSEVQLALSGLAVQYAWSPDGNYLAVALLDDPHVSVVNAHTGQVVSTHQGLASTIGLAWSPDSKRIAAGFGDGKEVTQVWDALTGDNVVTYHGGTQPVWSPDGKYIATVHTDITGIVMYDEIHLWNPVTGKTLFVYTSHQGHVDNLVWSPDSKYIASGERSGNGNFSDVHVWVAVA